MKHRRHKRVAAYGKSSGFLSPMAIALYAVGAYVLYSLFKPASAQAAPGGTGTPLLTGPASTGGSVVVGAPGPLVSAAAPTATSIAQGGSFWSTLTPVAPPPTGWINFPSGSQAAAALFTGGNAAVDASGNLYVQWAGGVYRIAGPDGQGNWNAVQVQ